MSKSLKNVVNPDDVVQQYGADSLRLYEMFMGPLDAVKPWQPQGIEGMYRFLGRAMRSIAGDEGAPEYTNGTPPEELTRLMHQSILKVTDDIENMRFNTAISQLMVFNNELMKQQVRYREPCEAFVKLLHPFAPHLCEELWQILGHSESLSGVPWPVGSARLAAEDTVEVVFQVNGKVRARAKLSKSLGKEELQKIALEHETIRANVGSQKIAKVIVVPGKLVNVVLAF
jgi:leucyl-tRNA synthetase